MLLPYITIYSVLQNVWYKHCLLRENIKINKNCVKKAELVRYYVNNFVNFTFKLFKK